MFSPRASLSDRPTGMATALRCCRRAAMILGSAVLLAALGGAGWAGYLRASGNVHTVIPGQLYRSAELSKVGFQDAIEEFDIETVINLRGANPGKPWYEDELAASATMKARHIDLRMSATHVPDAATLQAIRAVLSDAATPILIHCHGGADRSGLVAALYELWIAHRLPAVAGEQLSIAYGHFPWLGSRTAAMDDAWRRVLGESGR
jgi:protein tyrosine/serine phosphatase